MIRETRLLLYFFVGLLLSANVVLAYAEIVPVMPLGFGPNARNDGLTLYPTAKGFCDYEINRNWGAGYVSGTTASPPYCYIVLGGSQTIGGYVSQNYGCPNGGNLTNGGGVTNVPSETCTYPSPCVLPTMRDATNGLCKVPPPTCSGAQFLDVSSNKCICTYQASSTKSYSVSYANSKAGNLSPPTCSNGCTQAYTGNAIFCPGGLLTMVIGGSTTCYASTFQDGTICSSTGIGGPIQITLAPVTAPAAPAGTNPAGLVDPLSTTPNNGDPLSCSGSGGNWGVFNGKGSCYSPTKADPVLTQTQTPYVVVDPSGKTSTTITKTTQTCTGIGSCSSTSLTTVGGGGGAGGTTVTSSGQGASGSANMTSDGQGNYKLDLPKDYQRDSTGLILNAKVDKLLEVVGDPSADDSSITGANATDAGKKVLTDAEKAITDALGGQENAGVLEKVSVWTQTMQSGWFTPIPMTSCTAFDQKIGPYMWRFDHCPKAAEISQWGAYCAWILLMFTGFRMLTTPINMAHR